MKNKITHPVLIIWFAISSLILLSSVKLPVIPYLNHYSKIDILQDIEKTDQPVVAVKKPQPAAAKDSAKKVIADIFDSSLISDYADEPLNTMSAFYKKLN